MKMQMNKEIIKQEILYNCLEQGYDNTRYILRLYEDVIIHNLKLEKREEKKEE
jgi:hypothetical protein